MTKFQRLHALCKATSGKGMAIKVACSLTLAVLAGCSAPTQAQPVIVATEPHPVAGKSIVWGKVDLEPTDEINEWQPTVDYLASRLSDVGISSGEIKIAKHSETLAQWVAAGEVDVVRDSLYPAMVVSEHSGAVPLVVRSSRKPAKHAVFFVRADSDVQSLSDLVGKNIAFEEESSTSGFMLPMAHLRGLGYQVSESPDPDSVVDPDEIGYVFAGDDDVIAGWVFEGRVIAGAVDNLTFEEFNAENPGKLRVVSETESISSASIILIRQGMNPEMAGAIRKVLLNMNNTEEGRAILRGTKTVSFDEFEGEVAADWARTREKYRLILD